MEIDRYWIFRNYFIGITVVKYNLLSEIAFRKVASPNLVLILEAVNEKSNQNLILYTRTEIVNSLEICS